MNLFKFKHEAIFLTLLLCLCSKNSHAAAETRSLEAYATCAVYHRMLAGAYRRERQAPELADLETERMQDFIDDAKNAGLQTLSAAEMEQKFLQAWRHDLQIMESQINGNYKNIARLRINYGTRCRALQG